MAKKWSLIIIVAAATVGEGVFALPYVISASGWLVALCYFVVLTMAVSLAHVAYLRTLGAVGEKERLLGLARKYFGEGGFWVGFLAIVVGLLLSFVAYLVLGSQFLQVIIPGLLPGAALAIFWVVLSCLVWVSEGNVKALEVAGVTGVACAIAVIFFSGHPEHAFNFLPMAVSKNFFLPFGVILFSLAGWPAVEQVYEAVKKKNTTQTKGIFPIFLTGTTIAALLYWLFALGIISASNGHVTSDTISGVASWAMWKRDLLAAIGIGSMCVITLPIARALRGALEEDLHWNSLMARAAIIIVPLVTVLAGFKNFLTVISIAGGIFIGIQYLLIVATSRRVLKLKRVEKILLDSISFIFICAAVYEIVFFIVH